MRTTLTLDDDVAAQLRDEAARRGLPFRQTVNQVIRLGLRAGSPPAQRVPFRTEARHLGLLAGIDPDKLGQLADELEVQEFLQRHTRPDDGTVRRGRRRQ